MLPHLPEARRPHRPPHGPPRDTHAARPHPQDAYACAPGANGALDGCTACKAGWFLDTTTPVSVKYIDAGAETAKDYRGCKSCSDAFGCIVGAACDASKWRVDHKSGWWALPVPSHALARHLPGC